LRGDGPQLILGFVFSLISFMPFNLLLPGLAQVLVDRHFAAKQLSGLLQSPIALQVPAGPTLAYFPPILQLLVVCLAAWWCVRTVIKQRPLEMAQITSFSLPMPIIFFLLTTAGMVIGWNPAVPWLGGWTWQNAATPFAYLAAGIFSLFFLTFLSEYVENRRANSLWPPLLAFSSWLAGFVLSAIGLFSLVRVGAYAPPATEPAFQRIPLWQMLLNCLLILAAGALLLEAIYLGFRFFYLLRRQVGAFTELPVDLLEIEDLPCAVEERFRELDEELADRGFTLLGCVAGRDASGKWYHYSAHWLQPQMGAIFQAACSSMKPDTIAPPCSLYLRTPLSNGLSVASQSNSLTSSASSARGSYGYSGIYDPLTLYQLHLANVRRHCRDGVQVEILPEGEEVNELTRRDNAQLQDSINSGSRFRKNRYVYMTLKDTLRVLWQMIWPKRRRMVRETRERTREHLRELGLEHWELAYKHRRKQRAEKKRGRPRKAVSPA
jgi:hypothetical protein